MKYDAFISYSRKNKASAERIQKFLEQNYRKLPQRIRTKGKPFNIIRDDTDFDFNSTLSASIEYKLASSRCLIVLCSPEAKQSTWVEREINFFKACNPLNKDRIIPVLLRSEQGKTHNSFPDALIGENGSLPLYVDARDTVNEPYKKFAKHFSQNGASRVYAKILGIDFTEFVDRQNAYNRKILRRNLTVATAVIAILLVSTILAVLKSISLSRENRANELVNEALLIESSDPTLAFHLLSSVNKIIPLHKTATEFALRLYDSRQFYDKKLMHIKDVTSVDISAEGGYYLTSTSNGYIQLWHSFLRGLSQEKLLFRKKLSGSINEVRFSKEDNLIMAACDSAAYVIDRNTLNTTIRFNKQNANINSIDHSLKFNVFITGGSDGRILIWDDKQHIVGETLFKTAITKVCFLPEADKFLAGDGEGFIYLVDIKGKIWNKFSGGHTEQISDIKISADGQEFLTAGWDNLAILWKRNGDIVQKFAGHELEVTGASFAYDKIITCSWDKTVRIWERDGTLYKSFPGHSDFIEAMDYNPKSNILLTGGWDLNAHLWIIDDLKDKTITADSLRVLSAAYLNIDEEKVFKKYNIITFNTKGECVIYGEDGSKMTKGKWHPFTKFISVDKSLSISADMYGYVFVSDIKDKQHSWAKPLHDAYITDLAYSAKHQMLASADEKGKVVLSTKNGDVLAALQQNERKIYRRSGGYFVPKLTVNSVDISDKNEWVLTACDNGTATVWDFRGNKIKEVTSDFSFKAAYFVHYKNFDFLTTGNDGKIKFHSLKGGQVEEYNLGKSINKAIIDQDLRFSLVLVANDGEVLLFDLLQKRIYERIPSKHGMVRDINISGSLQNLLIHYEDETIVSKNIKIPYSFYSVISFGLISGEKDYLKNLLEIEKLKLDLEINDERGLLGIGNDEAVRRSLRYKGPNLIFLKDTIKVEYLR